MSDTPLNCILETLLVVPKSCLLVALLWWMVVAGIVSMRRVRHRRAAPGEGPHCVDCGNCVWGVASPTCPECGRSLADPQALRFRDHPAPLGPWIRLAVWTPMLLAFAGIGLVLSSAAMPRSFETRWRAMWSPYLDYRLEVDGLTGWGGPNLQVRVILDGHPNDEPLCLDLTHDTAMIFHSYNPMLRFKATPARLQKYLGRTWSVIPLIPNEARLNDNATQLDAIVKGLQQGRWPGLSQSVGNVQRKYSLRWKVALPYWLALTPLLFVAVYMIETRRWRKRHAAYVAKQIERAKLRFTPPGSAGARP